ncbi:hypothetical protein [Limimaricola pyoseonensis]|uniref:SnoaL-like domain-containing protein n=1 Tax=Limimaricola pyoseonensis TaxID=521013 RepID=A0A1G7GC46_9RHOB|nr:hypothetical protein [Limimaricola pyoseonensis]SDE85712.1 hypothetical protein SAMN04488567_2832 [Limimaricola pyoseonensis]
MSHLIPQFISNHARLFREGRLEEMLDDCAYPLAVQDTTGMKVLQDRAEYLRWLQRWQSSFGARAMSESHMKIHTLELPRAGRFRVWIERRFENPARGARFDMSVIYYCRLEGRRPLIEMIELDIPGPPSANDA